MISLEDVKELFFDRVQEQVIKALKNGLGANLEVDAEVGSWLRPKLQCWLGEDWVVGLAVTDGGALIQIMRAKPLAD